MLNSRGYSQSLTLPRAVTSTCVTLSVTWSVGCPSSLLVSSWPPWGAPLSEALGGPLYNFFSRKKILHPEGPVSLPGDLGPHATQLLRCNGPLCRKCSSLQPMLVCASFSSSGGYCWRNWVGGLGAEGAVTGQSKIL